MQRSSASFDHFSSQLPFGPKTLVLGAAALVAYGLTRRSKTGTALAAAGGLLAYKAARGQSTESSTHAVFLLNASPEQAYKLWRNFKGLPRFMAHLKSVRELDSRRSEWIALGPGQREIRWHAEITDDTPNQRIAWRSLPNSDVYTSGSVEFRSDPQGRGTFVSANVRYGIPGGSVTSGLAALFGKNPEFVVREDLRRFKQLLETGEVPTTRGQTHGPRGIHGHTEQVLFREKTNLPDPQVALAYSHSA
ncbi:SRPBCC family protein [Occallatibacter savannae]|uniref:SRPBCC family protein n=1 Tax=Occallatibacter savannae TaxID=1002691 RepID=UPI0013A58B4E|nr:SRPBCC family protein [Occallatibacter savannae]